MTRFKNILVVADQASLSNAVMERAIWLARSNGARVTVIDLIDARPGELSRLFGAVADGRGPEIAAQVRLAHEDRLAAMVQPLIDIGATVSTQVLNGTGFIEIIRQVLRQRHDLVLKGADRGPDRPFLRAPDLHLLRKCPCPVWIVNGEARGRSERILAAVDPDPEDPTRDALNHRVMQLATSLACADVAKLDVLNAWTVAEEATLRHTRVKIPEEDIQAIVAEEERASGARFGRLTGDYRQFGDLMRLLHIKGIAADLIPEHVESEGIDTLVMGTLGRTGISGFFIGNTAETVLNRVSCSVLAIKPEGFVSPVRLEEGEYT